MQIDGLQNYVARARIGVFRSTLAESQIPAIEINMPPAWAGGGVVCLYRQMYRIPNSVSRMTSWPTSPMGKACEARLNSAVASQDVPTPSVIVTSPNKGQSCWM